MIRKLRWKFVAVCMGLVALVLSAVFGAAYHAVRQNIEDLSRQMLYQVLREDSGRGAVPNPTIEIGGDRVLLPYFTVNIWGDTAYITGGTYADLENTDTLRDILSQCLEQEAAEGTVNEYHLRYLSMDNGLYRKLAFVDMSMEQAVLRRLVRSYLLIALGAMLVLLGIAAAASRWVTRPVEKAWKQQRQFLSDASHELKTPIALIQGYAEGLKEGVNDDPESREFYCEVIMDEAGKMNRMVKNLLALNQLEFGEDDVQFERFDITSLISGVLQSLDILIEQKEAQVIFRHKNPVYVWADEFKVEQVVRNYVNNALNHIDGEKVIEIKITQENDMAKITVFNTGTPIPEEDLPHIWEKFYKVDKARTREYGGNGIGLSIVKAIMDSFGKGYGAINHTNGVEFWFELDMK